MANSPRSFSKKTLSFSALLGFGIGIFCIVYSIKLTGEIRTFWDPKSVFITVGCTLGAVVVAFPPKRLKTLGSVMRKAFVNNHFDMRNDVEVIVALSEVSRRQGLLALEDAVHQCTNDEFLKKGILLLVDGADKDMLKTSLETEIYFMQQRHKKGYGMLDMIAATAPALGLLGTYVGLIPMLLNLVNPDKLGPLMAVELVTSFYGAFLSYVIFSPMSKRLKAMSTDETIRKELLIEGIIAIQEGRNPRMLRESLMAFMSRGEAKGKSKDRYEPELKPEVKKVFSYSNR